MTLLTYLKLDATALKAGANAAAQELGGLQGSLAGVSQAADGTSAATGNTSQALQQTGQTSDQLQAAIEKAAVAIKELGEAFAAATPQIKSAGEEGEEAANKLKKTGDAAPNVMRGMAGISAASSLMSGTVQGAATGTASLVTALKGLGMAAATPVGLIVGLVASLGLLIKAVADNKRAAREFQDAMRFENAGNKLSELQERFARLNRAVEGSVELMRELRSASRESADIQFDKQAAQLELQRKQALASVDPADATAVAAVNTDFARRREQLELDRTAAGHSAGAAEAQQRAAENQATIEARREHLATIEAKGQAARAASWEINSRQTWRGSERKANTAKAQEWDQLAQDHDAEAESIREEIAALERKNQVLAAQAKLYEERNEVVELRRQAAAIELPVAGSEPESTKSSSISSSMSVLTDRLTRIGGLTSGGLGSGTSRMETLADKQLSESRRSRELLERIARKDSSTAVAG